MDLARLATPLVVRLHLSSRPLWHRVVRPFADFRPVDLVFYDNAGEHFCRTPAQLRQFAGYVLSATGLIFLIDPEGCREFRPWMNPPPSPDAEENSPAQVVELLRAAFQGANLVGHDTALPIPTAVLVTKGDTLRKHFKKSDPNAPWLQPPDYRAGFDAAEAAAISADIGEYLRRAGHGGLRELVQTNFTEHQFFACSALGRGPLPGAEGRLAGPPVPFRVLDPLLWLLHRCGYLPTAPLPPALTNPTDRGEES